VKQPLSGAAGQAQDKPGGETVFSEQKQDKPADCQSGALNYE
jgi:hypothetical protein